MAYKVLNKVKEYKERIHLFLLILIAITIPFQVNVGNAALIIAVVFNIFFVDVKRLAKLNSFVLLFPTLFFFIVFVWAAFGKYFYQGIFRLDRHLVPILITIVLINQKLSYKDVRKILYFFCWSVVVATTILIVKFIFGALQNQSMEELTFHGFSSLYDQHPVYFSLYVSLALFGFLKEDLRRMSFLEIVGAMVLLTGLVLSASKAILFVDFLFLCVYFIASRKALKTKAISLLAIFVVAAAVFRISFIKERFLDGLKLAENMVTFVPSNDFEEKKQFSYQEKKKISDLDLRYLLAKISLFHLEKDDKLLFGYGPGEAQDYFDYYLYSYNLGPNWYSGFNVHNQYIHILLNYGVFVLLLFMAYLIFCIKVSIRHKSYIYLFFLLLSAFVFLFEVILIRNKGILFFYFFNILFLTNTKYFEISHNRD